jgi:hypothetical protein
MAFYNSRLSLWLSCYRRIVPIHDHVGLFGLPNTRVFHEADPGEVYSNLEFKYSKIHNPDNWSCKDSAGKVILIEFTSSMYNSKIETYYDGKKDIIVEEVWDPATRKLSCSFKVNNNSAYNFNIEVQNNNGSNTMMIGVDKADITINFNGKTFTGEYILGDTRPPAIVIDICKEMASCGLSPYQVKSLPLALLENYFMDIWETTPGGLSTASDDALLCATGIGMADFFLPGGGSAVYGVANAIALNIDAFWD